MRRFLRWLFGEDRSLPVAAQTVKLRKGDVLIMQTKTPLTREQRLASKEVMEALLSEGPVTGRAAVLSGTRWRFTVLRMPRAMRRSVQAKLADPLAPQGGR